MRPSRNPELVALWKNDRRRAVLTLTASLRAFNGNVVRTAAALHITRRTLTRWIAADAGLRTALKEIR